MRINVKSVSVKLMEYTIVFMMIFRTYSMLSRDFAYQVSEPVMDVVLIAACWGYALLKLVFGERVIFRRNIIEMIAVIAISTACILIPRKNIISGLVRFTLVLCSATVYFVFNDEPEQFWLKFVDVVTVMAVVSLILYFAGTVFGVISPTRGATYLYDDMIKTCNTYFGIQYESQTAQGISMLKYRNCGFFIEAPMYNILLCYALGAELSFSKRIRKNVAAVLVVTILTTLTTSGVFFLMLMMFVYALNVGKGKTSYCLKIILIPFLLLVILSVVLSLMESKMQSLSGSGSVSVRQDHIMAFLEMWMDHPLFGVGYGNGEAFYRYANYDQGYSVGLPALLGMYGGFMFLLYAVPWGRYVLNAFKRNKRHLYFAFGTVVCLFLTAVVNHPIMMLTIAFQLTGYRVTNSQCTRG